MADPCKHSNAVSTAHGDSGAHVVVCKDCGAVTHVCLTPLYDEIEKQLEVIRSWGVYYSKDSSVKSADAAMKQREMEDIITNLRTAAMQGRTVKNTFLEQMAVRLEGAGQDKAAQYLRDIKSEVTIPAAPADAKPQGS